MTGAQIIVALLSLIGLLTQPRARASAQAVVA